MLRLDDITIFVLAADNGSLSAAARVLNAAPAVASTAIKRLETELGTRLFARSTRSLRLTQDGERYLAFARKALGELQAGKDSIAHGRQAIGGLVSLSMPSDLGRNLLVGWFDQFQTQHPDVALQVRVGDRLIDMFKQPVDLVIRYGVPDDSTLVALSLAPDNRRVLCGSPEYFARNGRPAAPDDLRDHNCLRFALSDVIHDHWTFFAGADEAHTVKVGGNRMSDDAELVRRWVVAGQGLAYKSRLDVLADLRAGRLETVLDAYLGEPAPLHLMCTHRLMLSPTVSSLREFLQKRIDGYLADA
jgi:DNA-binding transcriptional LysR family regulator